MGKQEQICIQHPGAVVSYDGEAHTMCPMCALMASVSSIEQRMLKHVAESEWGPLREVLREVLTKYLEAMKPVVPERFWGVLDGSIEETLSVLFEKTYS